MTAIELSSYAGLTAMTLLTFNILIGLLMSVKYNPVRRWTCLVPWRCTHSLSSW